VDDQQRQGPPSTSSVLWAEWRRGLKDLQNFVLNPWQNYAATHEEPGTIANPTNYEVYRQRHDESSLSPGQAAEGEAPGHDLPSPSDIADAQQLSEDMVQGHHRGRRM
jgi:hypothetical protein